MPPEPESPWICSQLGAREHYAVPRALHCAGRLHEFHTDLWSAGPWKIARFLGSGGRDLAGRFHPGLSRAKVYSYPLEGIPLALRTRFAPPSLRCDTELDHGRWLDSEVIRHRNRQISAPFFSYTGTFLGTAHALRDSGALRVLGQVDPGEVEEEIVQRERALYPDWEADGPVITDRFREHRRAEWEEADVIVVNSEWSHRALVRQGVPEAKLRIIPLAYEASRLPPVPRLDGPRLRVLWLGQVILRKGIQYLLEAARLLADEPVVFTVAGPIGISSQALASAPSNVRITGPVSRSLAADLYATHDLFVLPTLSDGFGLTQLEAMAHGLPVIATPCCGKVIVPDRNGRLVPPADPHALAEVIAALAADRDLVRGMSAEAVMTSREFGLDRLSEALLQLVRTA